MARKRIALTMKLGAAPARQGSAGDNRFQGATHNQRGRPGQGAPQQQQASQSNAMSSAFAKLKGLGQ